MHAWSVKKTLRCAAGIAAALAMAGIGTAMARDAATPRGATATGEVRTSAVEQPTQAWGAEPMVSSPDPFLNRTPDRMLLPVKRTETSLLSDDGLRASACCPVGGFVGIFPVSNYFQGNVIGVNEPGVLSEFQVELDFEGPAAITFAVYKMDRADNNKFKPLKIVQVIHNGVGQAFYSSGLLNIALQVDGTPQQPLEGRYALGMGWHDEVIDFGRDVDSSFCGGTVVGWWGINANPPSTGSQSALVLSPTSGVAASMEVCFQAIGGSCCLDDTTCVDDVTSNACEEEYRGVYNGDFSICALLPPDTCVGRGACCTGGAGSCQTETEAACSGAYRGDGTQCGSPDPCDEDNDGACCFYDGTCEYISKYDCEADPNRDIPGVFTAPGVLCPPSGAAVCPVLGACCNSFDFCTDEAEADCPEFECIDKNDEDECDSPYEVDSTGLCDAPGTKCVRMTGLQWYEGEPCALERCSGPVGACCILGHCEARTQGECENDGGVFTSMGADGWRSCEVVASDFCDTGTNGADRGACCKPSGGCDLLEEADCLSSNGVFQGAGVACSDFLCQTGACCYYDGILGEDACATTLPVECASTSGFDGVFQGTGTSCPGACLEIGACCLPDGSCVDDMLDTACVASNGIFQGDLTECIGVTCPIQGSCCVRFISASLCFEESEDDCAGRIGQPGVLSATFAAGGVCGAGACLDGACCELDSTCSEVKKTACGTIPDGEFTAGGTCTPNLCEVRGACCTTNGCELATEAECTDTNGLDGVYRGDTTSCSTADICSVSGCCFSGGGCRDLYFSDCATSNGLSAPQGVMCGDDPDLCTPGACCIDFTGTGSYICQDGLNQYECDGFNIDFTASFAGPGSDCVSDPCAALTGACCGLEGDCVDGVTEAMCPALGGSTYVPAGACVPNTCVDQCAAFAGFILSDFNGDGRIDLVDYAAFIQCFGTQPGDADYFDCLCVFDSNDDGEITDDPDLDAFLANLESACCHFDGTCDDGLSAAECAAFVGSTYLAGESCAAGPCTDNCSGYPGIRPNDFDGDGMVDLEDFAAFQRCFGPTTAASECMCLFDMDEDGTIDTSDFTDFQTQLDAP